MLNSNGEHIIKDGKIIPLKDITDIHLVDCSIDSVDFCDWFGQELKEEES